MNTNLKLVLPGIALLFLGVFSCSKDSDLDQTPSDKSLVAFETEYSKSLGYSSDGNIKLIGYKKIEIPKEDVASYGAFFEENVGKEGMPKNHYFDKKNGILRSYFPVEGALVELGEGHSLIEANELGELSLAKKDMHGHEPLVIGRKQTDKVTGGEGNIIKDGIIYLAEKNKADHQIGENIYVYDFGVKIIGDHDHKSGQKNLAEGVSCYRNHGTGYNCSYTFGYNQGRCAYVYVTCRDYNGYITDCVNYGSGWKKYRNFTGSDCDVAMGHGHCWNEVM